MPHFFEKTETENSGSLSKRKKDVLRVRLSVGYLLVTVRVMGLLVAVVLWVSVILQVYV
jgi:hypothetical protein